MLYDLTFLNQGQSWPPSSETDRLQIYADNLLLFEGKHEKVFTESWKRVFRDEEKASFELIFNWFKRLSTLWADLLFGEPPVVKVGDPETNEQQAVERIINSNGLWNVAYEVSLDVSRYGVGLFKGRYDKQGIIEAIPPSIWFPVVNPSNIKETLYHVLAWSYDVPDPADSKKTLKRLKVEIHEKGRITYRTHDLNSGVIGALLEAEKVENTGINDFLVVPVHNLMTSGRSIGLDDYQDLDTIISELGVRVAQISRILDKHANPGMYGDESMSEYNADTRRYELRSDGFFAVPPGGTVPGRITWDGNLEAAFKQIELLMSQLYALSETSAAAFGDLKQGLAESGSALRRLMMAPLAKVNRIRMRFDPAITQVLRLCSELEVSQRMSKAVLLQGINISWQDGLPQDMTEAIQQESQAYQAGLTSRETSIRRLYGLDGKELQDELDRIEEEQALTSVPLATNTPFNQNDNSGGSEE